MRSAPCIRCGGPWPGVFCIDPSGSPSPRLPLPDVLCRGHSHYGLCCSQHLGYGQLCLHPGQCDLGFISLICANVRFWLFWSPKGSDLKLLTTTLKTTPASVGSRIVMRKRIQYRYPRWVLRVEDYILATASKVLSWRDHCACSSSRLHSEFSAVGSYTL